MCLGPWCGLGFGLRSRENKILFCQHVHVQNKVLSTNKDCAGVLHGAGTNYYYGNIERS